MSRFRSDPLDDALVRTWDRHVGGAVDNATPDDPDMLAMTRLLEERVPDIVPDQVFLRRLERELFGDQAVRAAAVRTSGADVRLPTLPLPPLDRRRLDRMTLAGWMSIAALLAVVLAGVAVVWLAARNEEDRSAAIPAISDSRQAMEQALSAPQLETLLDIPVDPAAVGGPLPTTWERLDFALASLEPGAELSSEHAYYQCCPNVVALLVMQGTAEFRAEGAARIFFDGSRTANATELGETYTLNIGDAVVFSTASGSTLRNSGAEELQVLNTRATDFTAGPATYGLPPEGVSIDVHLKGGTLKPLLADTVDLRFEQVSLNPGEQITVESRPNERLAGWTLERFASPPHFMVGDASAFPEDESGQFLGDQFSFYNYSPGPYTIRNVDDEPITLHFMRVIDSAPQQQEPSEPREATDRPVTAPLVGTSLDIAIAPADFGAAPPSTWDAAEFIDLRVAPGDRFSTDNPWFLCCDGISVYQVREGSLDLVVDGAADLYRAESVAAERTSAGIQLTLGSGDAIVMGMQASATFANASQENELVLLHGLAYAGSSMLGNGIPPDGYGKSAHTIDVEFEAIPSEAIGFSFEAVELAPGELYPIEIDPEQRVIGWYPEPDSMVRMLEGTHDTVPADDRGTFLVRTFTMRVYDPGPYTLYNSSETATTIYLMRMAPAAARAAATPEPAPDATPVAALQPQPIESLLDIQVNPAELDAQTSDIWNGIEFELVAVKSGESFTTDHLWFNCCPGMLVFQVRQGSASVIVDGPADFYPAGSGQTPVRVPAATLFALESGQTAVFAMENPAIVTNTGSGDLVLLGGFGYQLQSSTTTRPDGYVDLAIAWDHSMDPIPSDVLQVSLEQVRLQPGEIAHLEVRDEEWLAGMFPETNTTVHKMPGIHHAIPEDDLNSSMAFSSEMSNLAPGHYTYYNAGKNPATLLLMRIAPVSSAAAVASPVSSPVAALQPQPIESLLDIQVNPAELDAQTSDTWDVMEFSLVTVKAGEGFTTDVHYFTNSAGVIVLQVREGSASVIVDGPADFYPAGSGQTPVRVPAATLFALESGQTAVFAMENPAIVTNTGSDDLLMLGGYGYELIGPMTSLRPDGYHDRPVVYSDMEPIPEESLEVSFEQVTLEPGELTHIELRDDQRLVGWYPETNTTVRWAKGELDEVPTDPLGSSTAMTFVMYNYAPGPYTFFNTGENPASIYLLRIIPVSSSGPADSPVAAIPQSEATPVPDSTG
jgi:hypothetical protein